MAPKNDPQVMEQEYITGDESIRALAKRYDMSFSAVASRARNSNWSEKREAYRDSVRRRTYEHTADKFAREKAAIQEENMIALRATVRAYITQLQAGEIKVSAKDALESAKTLAMWLGEPTSRTESKVVEFTTGGLEPDLLRRLAELARARIVEGTTSEPSRSLPPGAVED
jgi:hypothetical protein